MKGWVNDTSGELECVGEGQVFEQFMPQGMNMIDVPDGYPQSGVVWNSEVREFVDDWTPLDQRFHVRIDLSAARIRRQYITTTSGQDGVYFRKENEARTFLAGGNHCPRLTAEAEALGMEIRELAQRVVAKADEYAAIDALIEAVRMRAKAEVVAARTYNAKAEAARIDWASHLSALAARPKA